MSSEREHVTLRPAVEEDAPMVFRWRNDPFLVARASSGKCVTWEEHMRWFQETLCGNSRKMLIVLVDGEPAGQVRFDRADGAACVISAYLLEPYTGCGLGVIAIRQACEFLFEQWGVKSIVAFVREDNPPSQSAFRKAGFHDAGEGTACPPKHIRMLLPRQNSAQGMTA